MIEGAPTAGMVYKLVAREDASGDLRPVAKKSANKVGVGGRKWAVRRHDTEGTALAEVLGVGHRASHHELDRELQRTLVTGGEIVGAETLSEARARHGASLAALPAAARQLSRGEPAIDTVYENVEAHR